MDVFFYKNTNEISEASVRENIRIGNEIASALLGRYRNEKTNCLPRAKATENDVVKLANSFFGFSDIYGGRISFFQLI